jgi:hypothetical protein
MNFRQDWNNYSRQSNRLPPGHVMREVGIEGINDWDPVTWNDTIIGPITVDLTLERPQDHFIITTQSGNRFALPAQEAQQLSDVDLTTAQGNFRATISDGRLAELVPAHRIPPGKVMMELGTTGSNCWEPVTANNAITGPITVDPTLERPQEHFIITTQSGNRFALPAQEAHQLSDVDLHTTQGNFRATISSDSRLTALVPAHRIPPGKVMMELGTMGSNRWNQVTWNDQLIGPISVDSTLERPQDHFIITVEGRLRFALPAQEVHQLSPVDLTTAQGNFRADISSDARLTALVPENWTQEEAVNHSLTAGKITRRSMGMPQGPDVGIKSGPIQIAGKTDDGDILYKQILPESGIRGSGNFIAAGTLSYDIYRFRPSKMTPPQNASDIGDDAKMYITVRDDDTIEYLETETERQSRLAKQSQSEVEVTVQPPSSSQQQTQGTTRSPATPSARSQEAISPAPDLPEVALGATALGTGDPGIGEEIASEPQPLSAPLSDSRRPGIFNRLRQVFPSSSAPPTRLTPGAGIQQAPAQPPQGLTARMAHALLDGARDVAQGRPLPSGDRPTITERVNRFVGRLR